MYGLVAGKRPTRYGTVYFRIFEHRFSVWPPKQRRDENETGNDSSSLDFYTERSNSSTRRLTVAATSFEEFDSRFGDHEGLRFVAGTSEVSTRISPFISILLTCRDCLLANLSALG